MPESKDGKGGQSSGGDGPVLHGFRFDVVFRDAPLPGKNETAKSDKKGGWKTLCYGGFSEVSGLEATMEPVAINEGGLNWGQHQRIGRTTFSTVILRRGITVTRHLWSWFSHVNQTGAYKHRLDVEIRLRDHEGKDQISWRLERAMPVKLKLADLAAAGQDLAIEELHLVHEGIVETLMAKDDSKDTAGGAK
ncbi:MAG: phage tail protein [Alphaproteobacteria bacterium]|nr:phage tail protein [Alphaproteobacteria bacterium]